ncbi:MAG TPA: response regulator, partial [Acidobacteriota bacterium]|nr:response regulator [Acidobacteriota bacterium]
MSGATILVVDDEKNQRELLAGFLRDLGYTVHAAAGRAEAFRVLERERVDLVLSDYTLGDGTGADILEHIRRTNPLVQFVLFTAYGSVKRAVDFMKQGAADYLAKPLDLDELEVKVRKIVQQKTVLEENKALRENLERRQEFANIHFQSRAMEEVVNVALRAAQ